MPEAPYVDSGLQTGLNNTDILQLKLETMNNFDRVMNQQPYLTGKFDFYQPDPNAQKNITETDKIINDIQTGKTDFSDYITHPDKKIRDVANSIVYQKASGNPFYRRNVGGVEVSPYDESMDKFLSKDYGFRFDRDNEDFYYRNDYMDDGWFGRTAKNIPKFLGRVIVPAVAKLFEGVGYVGSMLTSIGSDNYWADVADNGMSKWLEGLEQDFKDQVLPVYKQAGFDEKGFFTKLVDWSFWNDEVADGVAFMASAAIPGIGLAKLGTLGKFGQAFSTANRVGRLASRVGMGSWAELTSWTFNTAMEASMEGSGVFKEVKRRLELERAQGLNNLSDDDIRERSGNMAANTVGGNFAVLGLSNAFENTLFFKPFKEIKGRAALQLGEDFKVGSRALDNLASKNPFASSLSRTSFYGSKAIQGIIAEGLWEENAQLAIQRINQGDTEGRSFFPQLQKQTLDAFWGDDPEASVSMGLGALIGAGASTILSKASGERQKILENTRKALDYGKNAYNDLFSTTDVYERDDQNKVVFEGNTPKVDPKKMAAKQKAMVGVAASMGLTNLDNYDKSAPMQYEAKLALANYVRSLTKIGVEGVSQRMSQVTPETATLFGMDPTKLKEQTKDFAGLANTFENLSKDIDTLPPGKKPADATDEEYARVETGRKNAIYEAGAGNAILSQLVAKETSAMLSSLNQFRNLNNASLSQFPVDQVNTMLLQKKLNDEIIKSKEFKDMSDLEKDYHTKRAEQLEKEIESYKKNYELALQDSKISPNGYYIPTIKNADGTSTSVQFDNKSIQSQQQIAAYQNTIHKNTHAADLFADENGYDNYLSWHSTPFINKLKQFAEKAKAAGANQIVENKPGDFAKLLEHVRKTLYSDNYVPSPETQELVIQYKELVDKLMKEYKEVSENNRLSILNKKLDSLKEQQAKIANQVRSYRSKTADKKTELEILGEELEMVANSKPASQKRISAAIEKLEKDIKTVDGWLVKQQQQLGDLENQIAVTEQEIESGDLKGLAGALSELKKEKDWLANKVTETKSIVDRLKKLVNDIRRIAYKLFGNKEAYQRNLAKGRHEAVGYETELQNNKTALQDARDTLIELKDLQKVLDAKYQQNLDELQAIRTATDQYFKAQYTLATKQATDPEDLDDANITKGMTSDKEVFPIVPTSGGMAFDSEDGFDGSTYQRPLHTKFFTTTFQDWSEKPISAMEKDEQDMFALLEFLSSPMSSAAAAKKLGKGRLMALTVTRNNVKKLGLEEVLAERAEYFKIEDPALTHVEVIPVIEEGGYLYYIDTKLNRLGRVGEPITQAVDDKAQGERLKIEKDRETELETLNLQFKAGDLELEDFAAEEKRINDTYEALLDKLPPAPRGSANMVRRSLRTAKYTKAEMEQYPVKYSEEDMATALQVATDWRKDLLEVTAKSPDHAYEFFITRGIPNKMHMQDGKPAKNPVVGTILPKSAVNGQTVRVFSNINQPILNGVKIEVPAGRPFIYTKTKTHEQLHAADNQPLTPTQVVNVSRVFQEMLADYLQKVQQRISASTTFPEKLKVAITEAGGIQNLSIDQKRAVFKNISNDPSTKGFKLFNGNYTAYLHSTVYFGKVESNKQFDPLDPNKGEDKQPHKNQVYFSGPYLVFGAGGPSIDITDPSQIMSEPVQAFLNGQNHNIRYFTNPDVAARSFTEYYVDDKGEMKPRIWKNYSEYLISDTYPDGKKRDEIPVTTAIKTAEQKKTENNNDPYYPYVSRSVSLRTDEVEATTIVKKAGVKTQPAVQQVDTIASDLTADQIFGEIYSHFGRPEGKKASTKKAEPTPEKKESTPQGEITMIDALEAYMAEQQKKNAKEDKEEEEITPKEEPYSNIPDYTEPDKDTGAPPLPFEQDDDLNLRVAKGGIFTTEEDLDGVIADIHRMLPQFPVERLKRVIQTSTGLEAWGQFVDNTIKLYELAERGTGYHEAFEAVANKLLSNAEWKALSNEFHNRKGFFTDRETGTRTRYAEATEHQVKEELAEEFMNYKLNGTNPSTPQAKSFLRMIWEFIKSLFGAHTTIAKVFEQIEKGKFATRGVRAVNRFKNNYKVKILPALPIRMKRDLYHGATAYMFQNIFNSPESLTQLDDIDLTGEEVYEPIRAQFTRDAAGLHANAKITTDEKLKLELETSAKAIDYALENWKDFVEGHKQSIKHLRIKFEEQDDLEQTNEQKDNQNRNDYTRDVFKIDGKRSASKSVRFLFHALLKLQFDKNGETRDVNGHVAGKVRVIPSSVKMRALANYDQFMLKALEEMGNLGSFSRVEEKLRELSGISEIEDTRNPEVRQALIQSMDNEKATWTQLYAQLFGFNEKIDEESAWNLRIKFFNYISKHSPEPYVFVMGGSTSTIISSVKRSFFESITRTIETSLQRNSNLVLRRQDVNGVKLFVPIPKFRERITDRQFDNKSQAKFIIFLGLQDVITPAFWKGLSKSDQADLSRRLLRIRNGLTSASSATLNLKGLNIFGYTSQLIEFLDRKLGVSTKDSQFFNIENQPQQRHVIPSFVSRVLGEINNVSSLAQLHEQYPHTATLFSRDSILLQKLFDEEGNRTSFQVRLGYMEGIKDLDEQEGTKTARLEYIDKYYLQFNASLSGLYYSLPADSETEWVFDFGEFVDYSENLLQERGNNIISELFLPKLKSEIDSVLADNNRVRQLKAKHASTGEEVGKSLRFFKDILQWTAVEGKDGKIKFEKNTKLLTEIQNAMNPKDGSRPKTSEQIITSKRFNERIISAINNYLLNEAAITTRTLIDNTTILKVDGGYQMQGLNNAFIDRYANYFVQERGTITMSAAQLASLIQYQKINSVLGYMESFKIVFGDPAQYKDFEKRAKSLFGPAEQAFHDSTGMFNDWLNREKNSAVLVTNVNGVKTEEKVTIPATDIFRTYFDDKITSRTIDDFTVTPVDTVNSLVALQSEFANKYIKNYEETNETDGQSIGTIQFARQLMIKSGWRWTKEHEAYFQYDTALMRKELSEDGRYTYTSPQLKALDEKIVEYYSKNIPKAAITPIKTLMPSVDRNGMQTLLKHAVHFTSYQIAKEFELVDVYLDMLKRKDMLLNFISAQKVGAELDNNNEITHMYSRVPLTKEGKPILDNNGKQTYVTNPFAKTDMITAGNVQQLLDFKTIGIQVETQSDSWGSTLGSQATKDINLNLFQDGVPMDFAPEGLTRSEKIEAWIATPEAERLKVSENYRKVYGETGTATTLENLKTKNMMDRFNELGIKWTYSATGFQTDPDNLTKVKEYIHSELQRLEVDQNTLDNIELTDDYKSFVNPAETIPSYTTISNLLWALADKSVTSFKVNGKPLVQVSSAFFNKESRKAAYKNEDGTWTTVNTKAEYDTAVAEGKKMVMTSSELAFYRKDPTTGETLPMEIYLPDIYFRKISAAREKRGLPLLTREQLLEHLNANPKLLEGVGFRIPTQATSSLEFFKIKGFLPDAFGNAVVVPSAITTKGGSDFDVDKLTTYLNNWKLDKKGLPVFEEYDIDMTERGRIRRYIAFINKASKKDDRRYIKALARRDKKELINQFRTLAKEIVTAISPERFAAFERNVSILENMVRDVNQEVDTNIAYAINSLFDEGRELYFQLTNDTIEHFRNLKASLARRDVHGPVEIFEYLQLSEILISEGRTSSKDEEILRRMITVYNAELDVFQKNRDDRRRFIASAKETFKKNDQTVTEFYKNKEEEVIEDEAINEELEESLFNMDFVIAREIADLSQLLSFQEFSALPLFMQNSKGALENKYFESIRNVLKGANMFEYLLSPNSIDHIRTNRDHVFKALGKQAEEKKELDYTKFLSTEYIADKRNQFTKGKTDIGIFAVSMTNFANSQVSGIGISGVGGVKTKQEILIFDTLNDSDISLPFGDLDMLNVNGEWMIPISTAVDKTGSLTMDKISSYINGAVDVAKEPFIIEMGMHTDLAGVYVLMERMGLSGETTALFMYQPVVREFLKEVILLPYKTYSGLGGYQYLDQIIEGMTEKYGGDNPKYDPNFKVNNAQLTAMITKGEAIKRGEATWTAAETRAQYLILVNFLKMRMFAQHLLESVLGSNHDTASIRSPFVIMKKDLQMDRSKTGNTIVKLEKEGFTNGTEAIRGNTSVRTDVSLLKSFNEMLSKINLFALQKENPRNALLAIAKRLYQGNTYMSDDDFIKIMRDFESTMIDSLANKVLVQGIKEGDTTLNELYKYGKQYFRTDSPSNLAKRLRVLKKRYGGFFNKNYFLANLQITSNQDLGIDTMELKDKPSNSDVVKKEMYTEALLELASVDENKWPEIVQFYRAIVYGAFIQYGIRYSRKSFLDLIPVSTNSDPTVTQPLLALTDITKAALNHIGTEDFSTLEEQVKRAKWHRKGIVPEHKFFTVQFVQPSKETEGQYVLANNQTWKHGKGKPTRYSQTFFGRQNDKGEMVPHIHPVMLGMGGTIEKPIRFDEAPDIIKVPAIKPEFLIAKDFIDEERATAGTTYAPSPVVNAMMKRGDYSYMFTQLFKKVGAEDPSLGRALIGKPGKDGKRYISYLYKPINKTGSPEFNEVVPVDKTSSGTTIGQKSILDFPVFKELEDNDLINSISDKMGKLLPVVKPQVSTVSTPSKVFKPIHRKDMPEEGQSTMESLAMTPENIIKIAQGKKTTTIRSVKQAGQIGIRTGEEAIRMIGGTPYLIRNRGFLTIKQAGGLEAILKSEAVEGTEFLKFDQTKKWIQGQGKLFVYDILPAPNKPTETPDEGEKPPTSGSEKGGETRQDLINQAVKAKGQLDTNSQNMMNIDPEEFLKYLAEQYWRTRKELNKTAVFTPGTGIDAYPDEIMDIARQLFPQSDFVSTLGKPPISPDCTGT